jgi:hypothetical protein
VAGMTLSGRGDHGRQISHRPLRNSAERTGFGSDQLAAKPMGDGQAP